ncbi:MAG: zinc ribbon domain-containing protein [Anaerolineae bacterium]|nr:zinc ribbon domain-containing protein [Anaerolineae bacterium]
MAIKRLWLALFLCLGSLVLPVAGAQDSPILETLEISIWPEYDRPGALVIYRGQFDAAVTYPLPVELAIPAKAGSPHAVAYIGEDGGRFNLQHTTRIEGDLLIVAFDLPTPSFQLEYYDDLPVSDAGAREYSFTYTADYALRALLIEVQEPPLAQDFQLEPAANSSSVAGDGLRYHVSQAGSLEQGERQRWTFHYTKEDDRLTVAFFQQPTPAPAPTQPAAVPESSSTVAIFVVAFVALLGVGVAAYWLGQRTQSPASRKTPAPVEPARRKRDRQAYYCHKCGAEIRDDSHFCHRCGAAVRRE